MRKAALLDLDSTLTDHAAAFARWAEEFGDSTGIPPSELMRAETAHAGARHAFFAEIKTAFGLRQSIASSMSSVIASKETPVKVSGPPATRSIPRREQQSCFPRRHPRTEPRGEVPGTALSDLPLRISVTLAELLLALRVPLPGSVTAGPYAAFHDACVRPRPGRAWGELTTAGGWA